MNNKLFKVSIVINILLIFLYFFLENDRKSLTGIYPGYKCFSPENYNILELKTNNIFYFKSGHSNNRIKGKWREEKPNFLIFMINKNKNIIATVEEHSIKIKQIDNNNKIIDIDQCDVYVRNSKQWWLNGLGILAIIIFTITFIVNIIFLIKKLLIFSIYGRKK